MTRRKSTARPGKPGKTRGNGRDQHSPTVNGRSDGSGSRQPLKGQNYELMLKCKAAFQATKKRTEHRRRNDPAHRGRFVYSQAEEAHEIGVDPADLSRAFSFKPVTPSVRARIFAYYKVAGGESVVTQAEVVVEELAVVTAEARKVVSEMTRVIGAVEAKYLKTRRK